MKTLETFLKEQFDNIIEEWQRKLTASLSHHQQPHSAKNLLQHCHSLLTGFIASLRDCEHDDGTNELAELLNEVGVIWAKRGLSASESSNFIITLKETIIEIFQAEVAAWTRSDFDTVLDMQKRLDELMLICHHSYTTGRETLIRQQSAALLELSSPVVKMWDHILLMPLIGVIDTSRAKKITESLLTEITRLEATVAVMDLTGVPVFDTAVAGHLIKTINAAHMLGCNVIMTGISPDGALILTKLGIEFKDVMTRGNLHSGVKAALKMQGYSVVSKQAD